MRPARAFFSLAEIHDPAQHRAYNEWHQLDHRPENLALPGVIWGERWVRSPDCAVVTASDPGLIGPLHYFNSYLFREPLAASLQEWLELGEAAIQWGRRPDLRLTARVMMGFFRPVKGYVHPRVLVPPEVVPMRPNRGVHLTITSVDDPNSAAAEDLFSWYDRVRIPDLLECTGAAGAWIFASDDVRIGTESLQNDTGREPNLHLRFQVVYLDEDPLEFVKDVAGREAGWRRAGRVHETAGVERQVYSGPFRAIVPWQWSWFDGEVR